MSTDPEHRFELALQLGELKVAYQLAIEAEVRDTHTHTHTLDVTSGLTKETEARTLESIGEKWN